MDPKVTFEPSGKFQTIDELFRDRNRAASPVRKGLKRTECEGSKEEQDEVARVLSELQSLLSRSRVERLAARSTGQWDPGQKAVRLERKGGKFREFGYTVGAIEYLRNYEALFLLEVNRLEIYFDTVLVSVEQAYHLLLGQGRSREYDKYLVYSTLSRSGYSVQAFTNHSCAPIPTGTCNDVDCIWEILQSNLDRSHEIPNCVRSHARFESFKSSMETIVEKTKAADASSKTEHCTDILVEFQPRKRRQKLDCGDYKNAKRRKVDYTTASENESFLDCLKNDAEYQQVKETFKELEVVQLHAFEDYDDEHSREMPIDFDLYLPNKNFKKTGNLRPDFRVLILGPGDQFPSRSELVKTFRSQRVAVPLLVTSVSLSKHVQVFLYYFT